MADYTYTEIMKMQNDAIKRVEDMQKRARETAGLEKGKDEQHGENGKNERMPSQEPKRVPMPNDYLEKLKNYASNSSYTGTNTAEDIKDVEKDKRESDGKVKISKNVPPEKTENTFADLNIDADKALLLALIMLLSEEKGDELLIMALIYMLT